MSVHKMPAVGTKVHVETTNMSAARTLADAPRGWSPPYFEYDGVVIHPFPWLEKNEFCMTTDDPNYPVRVINMSRVTSINGQPVEKRPPTSNKTEAKSAVQVYNVTGSKGDVYTVTITNGVPKCTCPHNQIRRKICKHIEEVLKKHVG